MAASGIPKYRSISNDLRRRIDGGEIAPGERLAAQHALAQEYGVTVMTLRQALADLEADGLVHAVKGTGTFVSESPSVRYDLDHLWSFTQEMTEQGVDVDTEVLDVDEAADSAMAAEASRSLELADGTALVEVVRRRSIDGIPVVVQRSFVTTTAWSKISSVDLRVVSLYAALATACGLVLDRASEILRSVRLDGVDAEMLAVEPGRAAFESVRVSRTGDGTAFLYDRAVLSGDATEIRTERSARSMHVGYRPR
ncbi:MAG: GntR family transcriptional regulator [Ilumatobacter sp.]|uniref:GntR family transcriptional regulator n=1 Tax=Ilumatobacter sp. TaxID=1967498 RepID=UPI00329A660A